MIPARRAPRLRKKKGSYYADFYDRHRGRKWVALGTKNQRDAQRRFIELSDAYMRGDYDPWQEQRSRLMRLARAIDEHMAMRRREGQAERTIQTRAGLFRRFAETLPPEIAVIDVRPEHVRDFVYQPHFTEHSRATHYARLRTFFNWCRSQGYTDHNPCDEVRPPRKPRPKINYLTPAQLDRLLEAIEAHHALHGRPDRDLRWYADVVRFTAGSGLRLGELCALKWKDVHLAERLIVVRSDAEHRTKSGDSRIVQIAPMAAEVLHRLSGGREMPGEAYVFRGPRSDRLSYELTSRLFRKYRRLAKLPESLTFHSLRKTYGTVLASAGVPIRSIQKLLGHSDVRITAQVYADVLSTALREQVEGAFRQFAS
ncbi:hypothetical protein AWN76_006570 [Rhodothermaceae bacterium RA]|nr:hypothetical protein AWN76_006570 [Rhodothermaceae bacterium RA]